MGIKNTTAWTYNGNDKIFLGRVGQEHHFFFVGASMSIGTVLHSQTIFVWQGYYLWSSSMVDVENLYASRGG